MSREFSLAHYIFNGCMHFSRYIWVNVLLRFKGSNGNCSNDSNEKNTSVFIPKIVLTYATEVKQQGQQSWENVFYFYNITFFKNIQTLKNE